MMQVPDNKRGRTILKRLQKPVKERKVKDDLSDIPGALEEVTKLRKEVASFKKRILLLESRTGKLWADKVQQNIKEGQDVRKRTKQL